MDTQEQRIGVEEKAKQVYSKITGYAHYPEMNGIPRATFETEIEKGLQEYADLRCKPLIKALYNAKETLGLAVLLDKSDAMQNEINEIEKALQDYKK